MGLEGGVGRNVSFGDTPEKDWPLAASGRRCWSRGRGGEWGWRSPGPGNQHLHGADGHGQGTGERARRRQSLRRRGRSWGGQRAERGPQRGCAEPGEPACRRSKGLQSPSSPPPPPRPSPRPTSWAHSRLCPRRGPQTFPTPSSQLKAFLRITKASQETGTSLYLWREPQMGQLVKECGRSSKNFLSSKITVDGDWQP